MVFTNAIYSPNNIFIRISWNKILIYFIELLFILII